jgi:adenine-specific DNA-methyltransferase
MSRICNDKQIYKVRNGQIYILEKKYGNMIKFSDLFFVKVGAVSGADKIFINKNGNLNFVYSKTRKTGKTRRMFYNIKSPELEKFKDILLNRKINKFNEIN